MWILVVCLSAVSAIFCIVMYAMHMPEMYYRALSPPGEHFTDFTIYWTKFNLFHQTAFFHQYFPFTYPAPVALVYEFFFRAFGRYATRAFVGCSFLAVLIPTILFGQALRERGLPPRTATCLAASLLVCSWPALIILDRGNMEIVVWVALAMATWAYATGRLYLAAVFFGVAAALKLFPFIFFTLFLSTRRYRELGVAIAVFVAASVGALAALGPTTTIAAHGIADGLHYFANEYMARWRSWENGVDHSMFATAKMTMILAFHYPKETIFTRELKIYTDLTAVAGVLLYFLVIRFLPVLNQILILSIISIYFTAFSGDGTLFHLYYPLAMLIFVSLDAWKRRVTVKGLRMALLLLAFVETYESFFVIANHRIEGEVKCLALGWLLVVAFRHRFGPPLGRKIAGNYLAHPDATLIEAA